MDQRLAPARPASADRDVGDLSAIVAASRPSCCARDPYNRLLARGPRFRVDAEVVRDIALAASGLLESRRSAGRASIPPAPEFLFQPPASYGPKAWHEATGPDRYRRALYTFRFRSVPYPMLQTFDAPNGDFSCVRRARSNTPLQALTTLNEPMFVECARALALRALADGGSTDADRLDLCLPPLRGAAADRARETATTCSSLLHRQTARFAAAGRQSLGAGGHRSRPSRRNCPPGVTPAATGRLDGGRAGAAEPGRNDHQGVTGADAP